MLAVAITVQPNPGHTLKRRGVDDAVGNLMGLWLMRLRRQCGGVNCSKAEILSTAGVCARVIVRNRK